MMEGLKRLFGGGSEAKRGTTSPMRGRTMGYAGGKINRYTDFMQSLEVAHKERQRDLVKLRAHSRDLAKNNVYMRRFLEMTSTHIVGPEGITFESEIMGNLNQPKKAWNDDIEAAWDLWGRACTVDGRLTWLAVQQLIAETCAQDGEVLIRRVKGFDNGCRYALEIIDADRLDETYSVQLANGNRVIMGVEVNVWGRPLAYWIWSSHPFDYEAKPVRMRVPAEQIIHLYTEDRARATRGVPWATPCMVQINMLGRLWNAELVAANHEADRLGIIKTAQGVPLDEFGENGSDPVTAAEEIPSEHGQFIGLDPGLDLVFPSLQHPNSQLAEFSKALLKGIAAGLGVSYHSLAGDVSDANYSSARVALLDERDQWRKRQTWLIDNLHQVVYRDWLEMALLSGALSLPVVDFQKVCKPTWWARTWDWVDPQKDVDAALTAIRGGLSTYQQELGLRGSNWRETFEQIKAEQDYASKLGLVLDAPNTKAPSKPADPPPPDPAPKGAANG